MSGCECLDCDHGDDQTPDLATWCKDLVDRYERQSYEREPADPTEADLDGFDHAANE